MASVDITIAQNSLLNLRYCLSQIGWAKEIKPEYIGVYLGAKLLVDTLPDPSLKWVKSAAELFKMTAEERAVYDAADVAFAELPVKLTMSKAEFDACVACLKWCCANPGMAETKWTLELLTKFGLIPP